MVCQLLVVQFKDKIKRVPGGRTPVLNDEEAKIATPELKFVLENISPIMNEPAFTPGGVHYPLAIVRTFIPESNILIFKPGWKLTIDEHTMKLGYKNVLGCDVLPSVNLEKIQSINIAFWLE